MTFNLFDAARARELAEIGISRSDAHETQEWKDVAMRVLRDLAETCAQFTADEFWERMEFELPMGGIGRSRGSAAGARFLSAARQGWIEKTQVTRKSQRPDAHQKELRVWRSRLFDSGKLAIVWYER